MRSLMAIGLALLLQTVVASPAFPQSHVTVPDDYATIQGAIDSSTVDTIFVKDGTYDESLDIRRSVVLTPAVYLPSQPDFLAFPRVLGVHIETYLGGGLGAKFVSIRGFHIRGAVTQVNNCGPGIPEISFESCRIDGGLTASGAGCPFVGLRLRGCTIFGHTFVFLYYPDISGCSFIGGGLTVQSRGTAYIRSNYIQGPAAVGLSVCCSDAFPLLASDNVIVGADVGIEARDGGSYLRNTITDCAVAGIRVASPYSNTRVIENVVRRCGDGVVAESNTSYAIVTCERNVIDSVSARGIAQLSGGTLIATDNVVRVTGAEGILALTASSVVSSNRVLRPGGDGIRIVSGDASGNIVGRAGGAGIRMTGTGSLSSNTVYLGSGSGLVLGGDASVTGNISYGNSGFGIEAAGGASPTLSCNDWFSNAAGPASGIVPGPTDVSVNPAFCDLTADDVRLASTSPLLSVPGCGPIGAEGVGCATPVSAPPAADARPRLSARPVPAGGSVEFSWAADGESSVVEVFDVSGARLRRAEVPPLATGWTWSGGDDAGRRLSPGVYFVRRTCGARSELIRVVLRP